MSKNKQGKQSIFAFFRGKKRKLTEKQKNEAALEYARALSDKMVKDREDARNLFLEKLLENAKAYNEAKEDFSDDTEKEDKE